jgi:hypothetical protein
MGKRIQPTMPRAIIYKIKIFQIFENIKLFKANDNEFKVWLVNFFFHNDEINRKNHSGVSQYTKKHEHFNQ